MAHVLMRGGILNEWLEREGVADAVVQRRLSLHRSKRRWQNY